MALTYVDMSSVIEIQVKLNAKYVFILSIRISLQIAQFHKNPNK